MAVYRLDGAILEEKLKYKKMEKCWALERIGLQLQALNKKDIIFTREYIFKNIVLNRDLKIVR